MKVVIHGATNDSNFGDVLFAHLFYKKCLSIEKFDEVDFLQYRKYGIGDFCRNELNYYTRKNFLKCLSAEAFILMSGGSLGDSKSDLKHSIKRFLRFVLPARIFQILHKPVYILGVGGGPIENKFLRYEIVKLLNHAKIIQFRDEETKKYFKQYGVKNKMIVTTDTAQIINSNMIPRFEEKDTLEKFVKGRKKILLNFLASRRWDNKYKELIIPAVIKFLNKHSEYAIIITFDNINDAKVKELEAVKELLKVHNAYLYNYHNSWQLCSLINESDVIITTKLHMGIVGASLGKSVISFPIHREKTQRYYRQIGEGNRCIHMEKLTVDLAYEQLEKYHNKPIILSDEIRKKAQENLDVIKKIEQI